MSAAARPSDAHDTYVVDCGVYADGVRLPGTFTYREGLDEVRRRGNGFVWLGLRDPDLATMTDVARAFGLHELIIEDAVEGRQRPKLERYGAFWFMVVKTLEYVPHESVTSATDIVSSGEIEVAIGENFVVTIRHGMSVALPEVRRNLEQRPERLALGPFGVLHAIADHVVDTYLDVAQSVADDVDALEEAVFGSSEVITMEHVNLLNREVVEMRRATAPLANPLIRLTRSPDSPVSKEIRRYFRDVLDHLITVTDRIAEFDEILSSLVDAVVANIQVQQNVDMRKISAWAAIAAAPTLIAGIYGMNFDDMPELHWALGYPLAIGIMAVVATSLFLAFRRNGWL
ncbi:magnesium and cobalt transport protein CorA [Rhodococcus rhodnii]|uniref:Mg2 n=1 Tax=Rhodococcus rhodnii LMG 5362 TaxID=1273125 RepID=R7WQ07_9NOCA|nr:magnesium and cobalt transport protein CorA [Rhodococcus rhodnii]EOM77383.1 Mg2+ [Rhodococcus rhodnii LMG 5362]